MSAINSLTVNSISVSSADQARETQSKESHSILIGCTQMQEILESKFSDLHFILDDRSASDAQALHFPRDQAITRIDGIQLIPYSFTQTATELEWRFLALLPSSSDHFIHSIRAAYSSGFEENNRSYSISFSEKHRLTYQRAASCIEGGNCFLFEANGDSFAIVGSHSQVLSLLALEEQGYFVKNSEAVQKIAGQVTPSDWAIRMARNWKYNESQEQLRSVQGMRQSLFKEYINQRNSPLGAELKVQIAALDAQLISLKKANQWANNADFKKALQAPIQAEDRKTYAADAALFEAKLQLTKTMMAEELGVNEKNLAILPQKKFHLDMEMFLGLGNVVYMQDERLVQAELKKIETFSNLFRKKIDNCVKNSSSRTDLDQAHNQENLKLLSQIGCKVVPVAGFLESGEENINFLNGLLLDSRFITNEAPEGFKVLQEVFINSIRPTNPHLEIHFVGNPIIQEILKTGAGIHCLTREIPRVSNDH